MPEIDFPILDASLDPAATLAADFPDEGPFPISGGWGYSPETAVIFDSTKADFSLMGGFDAVGFEYRFIPMRLQEELALRHPGDDTWSEPSWDLIRQELRVIDGRKYDRLLVAVSASPSSGDAGTDGPDPREFRAEPIKREYWFDVTAVLEGYLR